MDVVPPLSPVEVLLVASTVTLALARWSPPRLRRPAAPAAAGAVVVSAVALWVTGARWQMLPVLVAAAAVLPWVVVPLVRGRGGRPTRRVRRRYALPGTVACLALIAAGPLAVWALPTPVFPAPTGDFAVGTEVVQLTDPERQEPATADPGDRRTVVAQFWYPARRDPAGPAPARYLGRTEREARTVADGLADYAGVPGLLLDGLPRARSHAVPGLPVAGGRERFPVVLFSPGLGGVRTQNTAWAEELASRGYVVVGLDHPYDSAAVVLDDGRTVRTRVSASGDAVEDERRAAEWTATRAADLRSVLTALGRIDTGGFPGPLAQRLAGRLDTGRVAATGHSLGGAAALLAARLDTRFSAVIDLDGYPHGPEPAPYPQPLLALTQAIGPDTDPDYIPRLTRVLELGASRNYRLTVPGAAHLTFTDAPLYLPPLASLTGTGGRTEGPRLTAAASVAFLDHVLRGAPRDPAAALASYGELTVYGGAGR
ncbi:alpha/beta hydrolase family protein [Streptomyces subrutilus]|uniref:Lipase n=1 Tax=Streptomyces subrutilus TaxID=36818 RepID=A0A5P2UED5_9ACTN|nr:hypothetical protein [Streptomyces subrutilus]QEU77633.1 hypothetical protein CP968_04460 [Streptomyces subrutilus]WSJ33269.1 hypothetical protein OG479_30430 [Streptomyces subrutilus]GGZ64811.1 lipase [Streptomyces subrutilus]